jgi:hypothetical protein
MFWIVYFVTLKVCGEIISKLQAKSELGAALPKTLCLWGTGARAVNNNTIKDYLPQIAVSTQFCMRSRQRQKLSQL